MAEFIVKKTATGVKFDLNINGHIVCTSEVYTTLASCEKGIESVKKNSSFGKIEDLSIENSQKLSFPKFQIYTDKAGKFRFRLCASNGQIIATSDDFVKKDDCLKVINLVINQAKEAKISK